MHPADIKASLAKAGFKQSDLARAMKVTQPAVHLVIKGVTKSERIAARISAAAGLPVKQLWPGKYPRLEKLQALKKAEEQGAPAH